MHAISAFLHIDKLISSKHGNEDWLLWDAEVITKECDLKDDFNKVMAMKTLYTTDAPWDNWELFLVMVQALNGLPTNPEILYLTPNPLPYLYNAVDIMNMTREQKFSEEVSRFCAAIFLHENVHYAPDQLSFAQIYISQPKYECKKCGKIGSALPPFNFVCEDCGEIYNLEKKQKPFNFKPLEVSSETTDIKLSIEYPFENVKKRYEELKNAPEVRLQENETDVQVGKLLLAHDFVHKQNEELEKELKEEYLLPSN
jgi:predicted nucleic acid-binding Zn ribbon protein